MAKGLLTGKTILVTGATGGIGRAAAIEFAAEGANVIAVARRKDKGAELVAEIKKAGGDARYVHTDIADVQSIDALFSLISRDYGRLDGAFNNAAAETPPSPLANETLEAFDRLFAANVRGTFWCMHHELRMMTAQRSGVIVNNGSVASVRGLAQHSVYAAAKHAVLGMTRSAALEVAALGIRVNCLCPGPVRTEMFDRWTNGGLPEIADALAAAVPLKRVATSEEIAATVAWLLSDKASFLTGAEIMADGGMTAA
jgi:NAD(P)-dependent dehydrogenase (short-subunit alcohol dehydrogenase family)